MGDVWFTADLHLGHQLVAGLRGFPCVEDHDRWVIDQLSRAKPEDQLWVLGDVAVSSPRRALDLLAAVPGRKHLVAGNHDQCHPMHRDSHKHQRAYLDVFESVQPFARRRVNGVGVLLSHFPYTADRGFEARYPQYRLPDLGEWLLHGHTHGKTRVQGREIHVGLDAWERLVGLGEIGELIRD